MKRRIISALLLIVMLISLVPAQAFAQETTADEPETLPEAQQIPAEETIPDEEVEIIPMPDAEYEEIIEEPGEEPEETPAEEPAEEETEPTDEPETDEEPAEKVSVRFDLTPAELTLSVYPAEEYTAAEPQPITPEADGTYLLLPGEYCYDAECEGYIPLYNCTFMVTESTVIAVALEEDSESTVLGDTTSEPVSSGECGENLTWTLNENGVLTISGTGDMENYEKNCVGDSCSYPNTPWKEYIEEIKTVVIESGVTSIGDYAFESYSALTSVTIPEGVTSIGDSTFYNCYALTSVTIPDSMTSIGWGAFYRCPAITSMTIPDSVTSIGFAAFSGCTSLTSIEVASDNEYYSSLDGVLFNKDATELAYFPSGRAGDYTIPNGVISIGNNAFAECEALTSVTIPNSVTSIGNCAFALVGSLKDAYYLGTQEQWEAITIGASNDELINAEIHFAPAISGSCGENLTWTLNENGVLTISGTGAMADYVDYSMALNGTVFTNNAPWYSKYIEQIIAVVIEPGVTSIGDSAFWACHALTSVTIPNSVTSIGRAAFSNCHALTSMTIHADVTNIGEAAFFYCKALTSIEVASNNEHYSSVDGILFNKDATELVCYPGGRTGSYTISESVNSVCNYAFSGCAALTSVTIPDSVTSIGKQTFSGCTALTDVTIPDRVTSIGDYAFYNCFELASVTIPESVMSIGERAFYGCTALTDVYYTGTRAQWYSISIGADNEPLLNAALHTAYMVSYDANGGEGAPAAQVKEKGKALKLSTVIPTRRHFTFLGWATTRTAKSAQYKAGASYTKDADVTLYAVWKPVLATKITVTPATAALCGANRTLELTASVIPAEADDTVTWSSSNEKIATVDENGVVTTHGVYGTVTITAAAADGSRRTGKCTLTVKSPLTEALTIRDSDGAECNGKAVFFPLISGSKYQYTAERTPADSASAVKWTSSNARVVTVSAAGLVSVKASALRS